MQNKVEELQKKITLLEQSENNLLAMINNREESFWSIDSDYKFVIINEFFVNTYFTAYHIRLKPGMNALEILDKELIAFWKSKYDAALKGEKIIFEFSENIAGEEHFYEVTLAPVYFGKKTEGVSALSREITNQKKNEEALEESENRYRSIVENSHEGIGLINHEGKFTYVNDKMPLMVDYPKEEIIGAHFTKFLAEESVNLVSTRFKERQEGKHLESFYEIIIRKKNGEKAIIDFSAAVIKDGDNQPVTVVHLYDITERKKAEKELRKLITAVEQNASIIVLTDTDGIIEYVNPSFEQITGYTKEEAQGKKSDILKSGVLPDDIFEELWSKITSGKTWKGEFLNKKKNGELYWESASVSPVFDEKGNLINYLKVAEDITRQKRNEEALRESEERYRSLFHNSSVVMLLIDPSNGNIRDANKSACLFYGYTHSEIISMKIFDINTLTEEQIKIEMQRAKRAERNYFLFEHRMANGSVKPVEVYSGKIAMDGKPMLYSIVHDITEQKRNEKALRESEEKFHKAFVTSPDSININRLEDGMYVEINNGFTDIMGYQPEEIIGKSSLELNIWVNPEDREKLVKGLKENGVVNNLEAKFCSKTGEIKDGLMSAALITFNNESYILSITRDITERKRNEHVQKILYDIANAVFTTDDVSALIGIIRDELGTLIDTTNFFVAMYNAEEDTFTLPFFKDEHDYFTSFPAEKTITRYVVETGKSLFANLDDLKKLEKAGKIERHGSDSLIWLGVPLKIGGKVTGAMVTQSYTDENAFNESDKMLLEIISGQIALAIHRKNAEHELQDLNEELAAQNEEYFALNEELTESMERIRSMNVDLVQAKEKAEESNRLKTAFLHNISHEIRTPMNGIFGFSELLKKPNLTGEQQQEYIDVILKSGKRMLNTLNALMDISMIESGQVKLNITETNINQQVEVLFDLFKNEAKQKGLNLNLQPALPKEPLLVHTDGTKVYGILMNLVKNAIKYTHAGFIEIGFEQRGKVIEFCVKDSGIGIPKDRQQAIFERFVQADIEDTRVYEGSGLGLSISKAYVEMLGGKIWVESEEGVGSQFYFTILYKPAKKEEPLKEKTPNTELGNIKNKLKVLIVEDEETSDTYLTIIIKEYCREILHAVNGEEAINLCRSNPDLDLVFMDIKMPVMGGYEATRKIREFNKEVIIIAQTAFAFPDDDKKAIEAGCNDYISKPIKAHVLRELMIKYSK